jgi:Ca2+:H+ antiporter
MPPNPWPPRLASAFSGARKNRLDLSVGVAPGKASQIALFVAQMLVPLSYVLAFRLWPGAAVMMLIAAIAAVIQITRK